MFFPFKRASVPVPRENIIISFIRAIGFFLFYYAVRTVILNAAAIFFGITYQSREEATAAYQRNANLFSFISGIVIILLLVLFFVFQRQNLRSALYVPKSSFSVVFLAFALGISLNFTTNLIMSRLPKSWLESYGEAAANIRNGHIVWYILAAVIMAPIVEELIFRAMMVSRLSASVGNLPAVVISAAIFGAIHGHIVWSIYAFLNGLLLGMIFVRSRSVAVSIIAHIGFNIVSLTSYIRVDLMSESAQLSFASLLGALQIVSLPLSAILIIVFIFKTKKTALKSPIGLDKFYNKGI